MATRLDRLFLLLETGSTPVVKKSAAEQLGEVQKLHPHELNNLLSKVHSYLASSSWDTRIAAGQAISAIAKNVPQWEPLGVAVKEGCSSAVVSDVCLPLSKFSIDKVLEHGVSLMGSEGNEYDMEEDILGMDQRERLTRQKQLLNKKLGLDMAGGLGIDTDDLYKEEDFIINKQDSDSATSQSNLGDIVHSQLSGGLLSARERNREKRKAKQMSRQISRDDSRNNCSMNGSEPNAKMRKIATAVVVEQPNADKIVMDSVPDNTVNMEEVEEWPFELFCELLEADLFSPVWERRHGAATGLREVIQIHGRGAGKVSDAPKSQMQMLSDAWLEDLTVRLICVLALDRFGDFVSDEVVAPVRETVAQALSVTVQYLPASSVEQVVRVLLQLMSPAQWEVRHGGLLGLKYVLVVRQDLAATLIELQLSAIFFGLQDSSDDVRGVAAAALLSVTDHLVQHFPQQVHAIVQCLWLTLLDLDDLTASTNSVMALLAALLSHAAVQPEIASGMALELLVPRLWPFLKHSIHSVRQATLDTLLALVQQQGAVSWLTVILPDTLRLVYQRCLLEPHPDILKMVYKVWQAVLEICPADLLLNATSPHLGSWLCLTMQPPLLPFDPDLLLDPKHAERLRDRPPGRQRYLQQMQQEAASRKLYIGGATSLSEAPAKRDASVVRARRIAARCLGLLCKLVSRATPQPGVDTPSEALGKLLIFHLNSKSAIQRLVVAHVISEWTLQQQALIACAELLQSRVHECLVEAIYFDEISIAFTRMQTECKHFIAGLREQNMTLDDAYSSRSVLTPEMCQALCSEVYDSLRPRLKPHYQTTFDERRAQLQITVSGMALEQQTLNTRVQCGLAGTVVVMKSLSEKMTPIVRPLMETLKREGNLQLQEFAALSLSRLIQLCTGRNQCPTPKIVKNLCSMLCSDPAFAPPITFDAKIAGEDCREANCDTHSGIFTLNAQQKTPAVTRGRRPAVLKKVPSITGDIMQCEIEDVTDEDQRNLLVTRRGASLALGQMARDTGAELPTIVGQLWDAMSTQVTHLCSDARQEVGVAQELQHALCVLEIVAPSIHTSLHEQLLEVLPSLVQCLRHCYTSVRHLAARCLAMLSHLLTSATLDCIIEQVLPLLAVTDNSMCRQGAIEAIAVVIESLQLSVVPYLVLVVVPVLGRMSDQDTAVRLMATHCFGNLIRIMPLEAGIPDPPTMKDSLLKQKEKQRHFLEQLIDGSKIDAYKIPIPIEAELRSYQQDGVNWLAFLNKYQLHGILCDDMGLGKTLQSICILAGDNFYRQQEFEESGRADCSCLPSLVVCPPTLTRHWIDEVNKFVSADYLNPLHYVGHPTERTRLQKKVKDHNMVVASYDLVRNDIQFFSKLHWNYCILDEGHVIKNHKTKLSKAVKQLRCNHRVILSGTPIQNNVLELWSLFDFLMPGFLGTERQFHTRYGRPIVLSRDARSSATDQQAGALAMEALHRQVLPFLLRRLKADVLADLPPKIVQDYYCDPSALQVQLYEDFSKSQAQHSIQSSMATEAKPNSHIFQALQYLRKVCNHPALVLTPQHPEFKRITTQLKEQHSKIRDIHHAPKLTALKQLLMDCGIGAGENSPAVGEHRVLLFCQLKAMLNIVEQDLLKSEMPDVTYLRLDGSVPPSNRQSIVNRFNNDPSIDILLLTTHVGGLGLNLTGADTVVFVEHDWNPSKDLQAMDRAHRIGQKKVVNVYRLITRGTLEEKIMGLQKFKLNIANTVISQENSSLASMGTDQLLNLFCLDNESKGKAAAASQQDDPPGLKVMLDNMGELWDEKQYDDEYNMDNFMQFLRK